MKNFFKKSKTPRELELEGLYNYLENINPDTEEYGIVLDNIQKLEAAGRKPKKGMDPVIASAIISVAGSLAATALILQYESEGGFITSHAKSVTKKLL